MPGAEPIGWQDGAGEVHAIRSEDVNAALEEICGTGATAKTFRTWNGTHAAFALAAAPGRIGIGAMTEAAAERLGNTPAIARSSYIHPAVIDLAGLTEEERLDLLAGLPDEAVRGLRAHEARLLAFLERAA